MVAITIRKAHDEDAALIASFNRAHAKEIDGITLGQDTALRGAVEGLRQPNYCQYYLAELDSRVVGLVMITYEWSDWRAGLTWWMQSVYVLPDFRRRGVFSALYKHIETLARQDSQIRAIRLYVCHHNQNGKKVYKQLGLKDSGYVVYEKEIG